MSGEPGGDSRGTDPVAGARRTGRRAGRRAAGGADPHGRARGLRRGGWWAHGRRPGVRGPYRAAAGAAARRRRSSASSSTTTPSARRSWAGSRLRCRPWRSWPGRPSSAVAGAAPDARSSASWALLWGASRFYAALDYAFTRIFHGTRQRNEIRADAPWPRPRRRCWSRCRLGRPRGARPGAVARRLSCPAASTEGSGRSPVPVVVLLFVRAAGRVTGSCRRSGCPRGPGCAPRSSWVSCSRRSPRSSCSSRRCDQGGRDLRDVRGRVRPAGVALDQLQPAARRWGVDPGARAGARSRGGPASPGGAEAGSGSVSPGGCRSGGRIGRSPTATGRS